MNHNTFFLYVTKYATTITNVAISLRDISIPPKKTKQSSTRLLDCFVFTKTFLFINSGRIICHVHKTLGNLIPIKSLVCHNDRFFKVYIIKIDKGFNRHQNI